MKLGFLGFGTLTAVTLLAHLTGCSSDPKPSKDAVGSSKSAIQGGSIDTSHPYAVGVCGGGGPGNCQLICSGALIAPNLVVTARHCVDQSPQQIDCNSASFGSAIGPASAFNITTNYHLFQSTSGWHQVAQIVTPTPTAVCGNDIALLILANNVPATEATPITPAVQYPITDHTRYSTTITAIGYGITAPNTDTSGTRRIKENINLVCIPGDKQIDCGSLTNANLDAKEFESGDGTCEGDSGSSAYEQSSFNANNPVSLGVLSRGGVDDPNNPTMCVGAVYTRLDSWKDLIISTVKTAAAKGGYALPTWTQPGDPGPPQPGTDSGSPQPSTDGGVSTGPAPGALGASCTQNSDCDSGTCRGPSADAQICTQACDGQTACPDGFTCNQGFCSPKSSGGNNAQTTTSTTTTSGCSVASSSLAPGRADPNKPVPWRWIGLGLVGLAALRRRRR
jgi:V8-like Glu-specific endopeptidase